MRLWHSKLIPLLDNPRLSDLHMSCCNLRGLGWGKRNKNINYIYDDPLGEEALVKYHQLVLEEMKRRDYNFDEQWYDLEYCGKRRLRRKFDCGRYLKATWRDIPIQGHTLKHYLEDVKDLQARGLDITIQRDVRTDYYGRAVIYRASRKDKETTYGVRVEGGTEYE